MREVAALAQPARGIGFVGAGGPGEQVYVPVRARLFGAAVAQVAAPERQRWNAWFAERAARARV